MRAVVRIAVLALLVVSMHVPAAAHGEEAPKERASGGLALDRAHTAVLIMDFQSDIIAILPEKEQAPHLDRAASILGEARQAGLPVIYIVVRFRDGYPEIDPGNRTFSRLKDSGRLREGTPGAEIHPRVAPQPGDLVVTKRRVGAFSSTELETLLRANGIDTLVLFGIATSGVVLTTVRQAADLDYQLVVVSDACADRSDEVHRVLMERVFPGQATVVTTREVLRTLGRLAAPREKN